MTIAFTLMAETVPAAHRGWLLEAPATVEIVTDYLLTNAFRDLSRQFGSSVGQHDHKLVAAIASDGVSIAYGREDHGRHFHQHV